MERPEKKKRRSREKDDDHDKKRRRKNHNVLKIRQNNSNDHGRLEKNKDKNDLINYHHRDHRQLVNKENVNDHASSSSSSSSTSDDVGKGELGIFDFPWLKDENSMFRGDDDVEQLCRSSLELDMIYDQQHMLSYATHNNTYFDHDLLDCNVCAKTWKTEINQHGKYCTDKKCDCASEFESAADKIELAAGCRMEYYIWMSVLDQPLM